MNSDLLIDFWFDKFSFDVSIMGCANKYYAHIMCTPKALAKRGRHGTLCDCHH
jgi:hypothetical protein